MESQFIVEASAKHVHVTRETLDILYGKDYKLTPKKNLSQPGQFACEEKLTVVGEKGEQKMSILGPCRPYNQIEVSYTDARALGVKAPLRMSGDLEGAGSCKLIGPKGEVEVKEGVIIAKRHLHATPADAARLGIKDGDVIKVEVDSPERKLIFDDVLCRVTETAGLAMHIDTDESNAAYGCNGGRIVR